MLVGLAIVIFVKDPAAKLSEIAKTEQINQLKTPNDEQQDSSSKKRKPNAFNQFISALVDQMRNKTTRYATLGGMFNYFSNYSVMYFMPAFFQQVYPGFKGPFAKLNGLSMSTFGFMSSLIGGIIADRYSKKYPKTMANICIASAILVIPFNLMAFLTTGNFWIAMTCLAIKYLIGEAWGSPQISIQQATLPKEKQGPMISANTFYMTISGTIGTAVCGYISNALNATADPIMLGKILAVITTSSSLMAIPFFWLAGKHY